MGNDKKLFTDWSTIKQVINSKEKGFAYAHPREIWWCSLGKNIGIETDGKHDIFERPVLILSMDNQYGATILPLTSKNKKDIHHVCITYTDNQDKIWESWIKLGQIRTISTKRLRRKVTTLEVGQFEVVKEAFIKHL